MGIIVPNRKHAMSIKHLITAACASLLLASSAASAAPVLQYASTVKDFSSQYSAGSWSAAQVLGAPNTFLYGDYATAWAPRSQNGTMEFISVGFTTAVYATGATIRETSGNGFVTQVDVIDTLGKLHTVWSGTDTSVANVPFDFGVSWATTSFLVSGLKVYVNTNHTADWEEIDAIRLAGDSIAPPAPIPEPATLALMGAGFGLLGLARRRRNA